MVLSLVGVAIIILEPSVGDGSIGSGAPAYTVGGLLLLFGAVLSAVGYTVVVKRLPGRYRPLTVVKVQSLIGFPIFAIMAIAIDGIPAATPSGGLAGATVAGAVGGHIAVPAAGGLYPVVLHLLYLALFPSSLAFVFYSTGIRRLGTSRANVFTNLVPGFTAVTAWLLLDERFSFQKIAGMIVVVAGVLTAQLARSVAGRSGNACRPLRRRAPR